MRNSLIFLFFLISFQAFPQEVLKWRNQVDIVATDSMGIICRKPIGFSDSLKFLECFDNNYKLRSMMSCCSEVFLSEDGECIIFLPIYRPFSKKEVEDMVQSFPDSKVFLDIPYLGNLQRVIRGAYGEDAVRHWKDYVTYYTPEDSKLKFNADTAVAITVDLDSESFYQGKYGYLDGLFVTKKGRGFINYFLFYTEDAKKNIAGYRKNLEVLFQYNDEL